MRPVKLFFGAGLSSLIFFLTINFGYSNSPDLLNEGLDEIIVTDANVFGHVIGADDGEHIPFINVQIKGTRFGTITDASGHYLLTNLPVGSHTLVVSGMGYLRAEVEFEIKAGQSIEIDVVVEYSGVDIAEIVITSSPTASGFRYQPDMAYMGEALQKRSEVSFGEMLNHSPGIAMSSLGSAPSRPVIRGMDGDRILVLENGERMGDISETSVDHTISLDPLVASRVEVVRGPASLLYGSSALGGVINLMTTDIPDSWDNGSSGVFSLQGATNNSMGAGFGRYSYGNERNAFTGRIAYREAGNIRTPDGVLPGTSMRNIDASAGYGFNRGTTVGGISFSATDMSYEIPESIDIPEEGVRIGMNRQSVQGRLSFRNSGFLDRGQVRFSANHMFQEEIEYEWDQDVLNEEVELTYDKYTFSSTLTLQHKPFSVFDRGAIGLSIYGHSLDVGGEEIYTPGERRINIGIFTFQEIPLSNTFRLQAGVRSDIQHTGALANSIFPNIDSKRTAFNYSGSIGFNLRPVEGLEIGGQFARSHRNPSVEELFANGAHLGMGVYEVGNSNLKDEVGQGADFFILYDNSRFAVELALFTNYFRNYIIFEPVGTVDPGSGFPVFNYTGDEARLYGGELTAGFELIDGLNLNFGADIVIGERIGNGNYYLPFMPPFRLMADFEYDYGWGWVGGKFIAAARQTRVSPEEDTTQGYQLIGLTAGYRFSSFGRHVIIFRVDNLLDKRYRDHLSRVTDRNFPMPGRNFTLAYRLFF